MYAEIAEDPSAGAAQEICAFYPFIEVDTGDTWEGVVAASNMPAGEKGPQPYWFKARYLSW
jgi:hypothetical protein